MPEGRQLVIPESAWPRTGNECPIRYSINVDSPCIVFRAGVYLMRTLMRVVLIFAVCGFSVAQDKPPAYLDPSLPAPTRAHDLVGRMTLDEKTSQLEDWAVAIPRLGVPDYQTWSEALHGVARSGYATVFPQAIGMAATWDPALVQKMGNLIAEEAR